MSSAPLRHVRQWPGACGHKIASKRISLGCVNKRHIRRVLFCDVTEVCHDGMKDRACSEVTVGEGGRQIECITMVFVDERLHTRDVAFFTNGFQLGVEHSLCSGQTFTVLNR